MGWSSLRARAAASEWRALSLRTAWRVTRVPKPRSLKSDSGYAAINLKGLFLWPPAAASPTADGQ